MWSFMTLPVKSESLLCPVLAKQSQCYPNSKTWNTDLSKNLQALFETTTTYFAVGGKLPQVS